MSSNEVSFIYHLKALRYMELLKGAFISRHQSQQPALEEGEQSRQIHISKFYHLSQHSGMAITTSYRAQRFKRLLLRKIPQTLATVRGLHDGSIH
jgi:hypothetical protein